MTSIFARQMAAHDTCATTGPTVVLRQFRATSLYWPTDGSRMCETRQSQSWRCWLRRGDSYALFVSPPIAQLVPGVSREPWTSLLRVLKHPVGIETVLAFP